MANRNATILTDDELEVVFDEIGACVDVGKLAWTNDTISDFLAARGSWAEAGVNLDEGQTDEGFAYLSIDRVQRKAGEPRKSLYVIDFGAVRAAALT